MTDSPPEGSGSKGDPVNYDDPLYIHPSDNTVTTIVSFKLTGTDNFHIWHNFMIRSLKARNKLGFVEGTVKKDSSDEPKSLKWEHANVVVCSWILGYLSESIYYGHAYSKSVVDIWNELFETYNKADGSVIFNVHQHINSLKQDGSSLSEYYNKLDTLWKEFDGLINLSKCTCDAAIKYNDHSKLMKLMQFLSGLDDSFNKVKSHILLMDHLPNIKTTFSIVSREESHQKNGALTSVSNVSKT